MSEPGTPQPATPSSLTGEVVSTIRDILAPGASGRRMNPDTTLDLPPTPTAPAPAPEVDDSVSFDAKSSNSAKQVQSSRGMTDARLDASRSWVWGFVVVVVE